MVVWEKKTLWVLLVLLVLLADCKKIEEADIIFLVDGSGSISLEMFMTMQRFMSSMVNQTMVGKDLTRFGVILFSSVAKAVFTLKDYTCKEEVLNAISQLESPQGFTYTGRALAYSLQFFNAEHGGRAALQVPQILILITDGPAHDRNNLVASSKVLRDNNITVLSIGVKGADMMELEVIAGHDKSKVFYVANFAYLEPLSKDITQVLYDITKPGSDGPTIIYPFPSTCAVRGSTVTLPCSFTPLKSITKDGRNVSLEIITVVWRLNHEICHLTAPTVYNSSGTNDPRYQYLGDMRSNCTLQIRDIQMKDNAVFRFRMEANDPAGHFTNRTGVKIRVVDGDKMSINSSRCDRALRGGDTFTLSCTARCTFHPLEVAWFKDGHALSESGPALQLGPLTAEDSGNYTCALRNYTQSLSAAYSLQVEGLGLDKMTIIHLVLFSLHTVLIIMLVVVVIRSTCVCRSGAAES